MEAGIEKLKIGLARLAKAGDDPDLLGAALTSIHGALEDRFRHLLATTTSVPERDHPRILDVAKVQWSELIDLMRLHRGLSAEDATLIRTMNRERQAVAHGGRFRGKRAAIERYATFALGFFPTVTTALDLKVESVPQEAPAKPVPRPAPKPKATKPPAETTPKAAPTIQRPQPVAKPASARVATPARATGRSTPTPRMQGLEERVRHNPGLMLTAMLLLILACFALGSLVRGSVPNQGDPSSVDQVWPTLASPIQMVTTVELNLRSEPGMNSSVLTTIPQGTTIMQISDGPERDQHRWVRVRYMDREGWVDTIYLRNP